MPEDKPKKIKPGKINYIDPDYYAGVDDSSSRWAKMKTEIHSRKHMAKKYFPALAAVGATGAILRSAPDKVTVGDTDISKSTLAAGAGAAGLGAAHAYDRKSREIKLNKKSKNVAVLYSGHRTGGGHEAPARAIAARFARKGYNVDMIDHQKFPGYWTQGTYDAYVASNQKQPAFDHLSYKGGPKKEGPVASAKSKGFKMWREFQRDWTGESAALDTMKGKKYNRIVVPHPVIPAHFAGTKAAIDVVATDKLITPELWDHEHGGRYFVAGEESARRLKERGVSSKRITKMPHIAWDNERFSDKAIKNAKKPKLFSKIHKKNPKAKIVTVMGGAYGMRVDEVVESTAKAYKKRGDNVKIVAVTGNDKSDLYKSLKKKKIKNVEVVGRVNDMPAYMRHSHAVISRPGGAATSELAAVGTPTLTFNEGRMNKDWKKIPEHETGNAKFLKDRGQSVHATLPRDKKLKGALDTEMLSRINELEDNHATFKSQGAASAKKFRAMPKAEGIIANTKPGPPVKSLSHFQKTVRGGAIAGGVIGGGLLLRDIMRSRKKRKKNK